MMDEKFSVFGVQFSARGGQFGLGGQDLCVLCALSGCCLMRSEFPTGCVVDGLAAGNLSRCSMSAATKGHIALESLDIWQD
jgi:hypothetical protein